MLVKKLRFGWLHKCDLCDAEFKGKKKRRFCCTSCNTSNNNMKRHAYGADNPNWRGGTRAMYKIDHPDRVKANSIVSEEYRHNRLTREPCENCGAPDALAHHEDYSEPLKIKWLCPSCHAKYHFAKRDEEAKRVG